MTLTEDAPPREVLLAANRLLAELDQRDQEQRTTPTGDKTSSPRSTTMERFNPPPYVQDCKTVGFSAAVQAFEMLRREKVENPTAEQLAAALRKVNRLDPSSRHEERSGR